MAKRPAKADKPAKAAKAEKAAAAKPAAKAEGAGDAAADDPQVAHPMSKRKLTDLMRVCRTGSKDVASINGTVREEIGTAKRNDHLHTGAFSWIRKLDNMEPAEIRDHIDYFDHYYEISGLQARAESAPRLEFGPGKDGDDDGKAGEQQPEQPQPQPQPEQPAQPQPTAKGGTVMPFPETSQRAAAGG